MRLLGNEHKERGTRGAPGLGRRWVSKVASGQTPAFGLGGSGQGHGRWTVTGSVLRAAFGWHYDPIPLVKTGCSGGAPITLLLRGPGELVALGWTPVFERKTLPPMSFCEGGRKGRKGEGSKACEQSV